MKNPEPEYETRELHDILKDLASMDDLRELIRCSITNKAIHTAQQVVGNTKNGDWKFECSSYNRNTADILLCDSFIAKIEIADRTQNGRINVSCQFPAAAEMLCGVIQQATGRETVNLILPEYEKAVAFLETGETPCFYRRTYSDGTFAVKCGHFPDVVRDEYKHSSEVYRIFTVDTETMEIVPLAPGYGDYIADFIRFAGQPTEERDSIVFDNADKWRVWDGAFIPVPAYEPIQEDIKIQTDIETELEGKTAIIPLPLFTGHIAEFETNSTDDYAKRNMYSERLIAKSDGKFTHIQSYWGLHTENGKQKSGYVTNLEEMESKQAYRLAGDLIKRDTTQIVLHDGTAYKADDYLQKTGFDKDSLIQKTIDDLKENPIQWSIFKALAHREEDTTSFPVEGRKESVILQKYEEGDELVIALSQNEKTIITSSMQFQTENDKIVPKEILYRSSDKNGYCKFTAECISNAVNLYNLYIHQKEPEVFPILASNASKPHTVSRTDTDLTI